VRAVRPKPQPPSIAKQVEVLARLVSQAANSESFKVLLIADPSGFRYEVVLQHPRQKWKDGPPPSA
jgi:hypothetical protein